jgi:predicted Zn-dependent protease with MMP-like domain/Flp pilus assembly protein TadD
MPRQDRLSADIDRGFTALENGEVDVAAAAVERCQRIDRKNPDVVALSAAVADARGEIEEAMARYRELADLRPDDPMPRVCIARIQLHDQGDPDAALETIAAAFDFIDEERDLIDAIVVRSEALIALDDLEAARAALSELSTSVIDDGEVALDLAELALAAKDFAAAKRWIEIGRTEPSTEADALHLLGRVHEATNDRAAMVAAWKRVREIDATTASQISVSEDELARIAEAALAELPSEVHAKLEHVPILIDDLPSTDLIDDGLDPRLLGLFQGTPMPEDAGLAPNVTTILLFRKNLERVSSDLDELAAEVRITVLHETAHYFGLDEDDLERLGLD